MNAQQVPIKIAKRIMSYAVGKPNAERASTMLGFHQEPDRRLKLVDAPSQPPADIEVERQPRIAEGNVSWCYWVRTPRGKFAVFIGQLADGRPFEVVCAGDVQPELQALARSLSMDLRARDKRFLRRKLESIAKTKGFTFDMVFPDGRNVRMPSEAACFAQLVLFRCKQIGWLTDLDSGDATETSWLFDSRICKREPRIDTSGVMSWTAQIENPSTGDDLRIFMVEAELPEGQRRPISVWLSGEYDRSLDGLARALSLDMQVSSCWWLGRKLVQLRDCHDPRGDFRADVPGSEKSAMYKSTVSYMAELILHRFVQVGLLTADGRPPGARTLSLVDSPMVESPADHCGECGSKIVLASGCRVCSGCGASSCS